MATNNRKLKLKISLKVASKYMKYLGVYLTKYVEQ